MMPGVRGAGNVGFNSRGWIPARKIILMTDEIFRGGGGRSDSRKGRATISASRSTGELCAGGSPSYWRGAEERRRTYRLDHELMNACQFEGIVGRSPIMLDVFAKIRRVAAHFRTVLVSGPQEPGKSWWRVPCIISVRPPAVPSWFATVRRSSNR